MCFVGDENGWKIQRTGCEITHSARGRLLEVASPKVLWSYVKVLRRWSISLNLNHVCRHLSRFQSYALTGRGQRLFFKTDFVPSVLCGLSFVRARTRSGIAPASMAPAGLSGHSHLVIKDLNVAVADCRSDQLSFATFGGSAVDMTVDILV